MDPRVKCIGSTISRGPFMYSGRGVISSRLIGSAHGLLAGVLLSSVLFISLIAVCTCNASTVSISVSKE